MSNNRLFSQFSTVALVVRRNTGLLVAIALMAGMFSIVMPALATYPGQNGRIGYGVYDPMSGSFTRRYTANPDGSNVQLFTDLPGFLSLNWSPDGNRIAFEFIDANGYVQIATAAPDGSDLQVLTSGPLIHEAADWSPDGTQLVYDYSDMDPSEPGFSTALWVMNADGTNAHPLLAPELSGFDVEPRWQPTGELITFIRIRKWIRGLQQEAVFVVDADGTNPRQLTSWGLAAEHPTWSPDGNLIIFNDKSSNLSSESIWTMKPDGTDKHVLYQGTMNTGGTKPWFSPDGSKILFVCITYGHSFNTDLCIMNVDGSGVVNITKSPGIYENIPSWGTAPLQ